MGEGIEDKEWAKFWCDQRHWHAPTLGAALLRPRIPLRTRKLRLILAL
jgi:hypothetical protein